MTDEAQTPEPDEPSRFGWVLDLALAVLAFCAAWWIGSPALSGGLVSDDFAFPLLCTDDDGSPAFGRIGEDLTEGWLGGDAPLIRPGVTASLVTDIARADDSTDPTSIERAFHETNLLLHGLTAALSVLLVGACLRRLGRRQGVRWVAGAAGLLVALHPIAVEPVSWIAARNSSLEVVFRTSALLLWVRFLTTGHRRWIVATALLSGLALLTKETAAVLPLLFVAFDLWLGRAVATPWKQRVGDLLRVSPPFLLYLLLRIALFGTEQTPGGEGGEALTHLAERFLLIGAPGYDDAATGSWALLPAIAVFALVACGRRPLHLLAGGVVLALATAPTLGLSSPNLPTGHRTAYGLLVLAMPFLAAAIHGAHFGRARTAVAVAALTTLLASLGWISRQGFERYDEAWQDLARARTAIVELDDEALAIAAMPEMPPGVPPFNQNNWFLPFQQPLHPDGIVVFGLGHQVVEIPGAEQLLGNATAMRVLLDAGIPIVSWSGERFLRLDRSNRPALPGEILVSPEDGRFRLPLPIDPFAFEAVRIQLEAPSLGGKLILDPPPDPSLPPETWEVTFDDTDVDGSVVIDLSPNLILAALSTFGVPITGFRVETSDGRSAKSLVLLPRIPRLDWPDEEPNEDGAQSPPGELPKIVRPETGPRTDLRVWVLSPHSAVSWIVSSSMTPPMGPELPGRWQHELPFWLGMSRPHGELAWFVETIEGPSARTGLRRARVR